MRLPLDELSELTGIIVPEGDRSHTVAGFVVQGFGRLPEVGEIFETQGWRFEVQDLDGRRIDKVLATRIDSRKRPIIL